jgi:hypothetical protein
MGVQGEKLRGGIFEGSGGGVGEGGWHGNGALSFTN